MSARACGQWWSNRAGRPNAHVLLHICLMSEKNSNGVARKMHIRRAKMTKTSSFFVLSSSLCQEYFAQIF